MIQNAKITSAEIFGPNSDNHGCSTIWMMLDYGGSGQGFGGYRLDSPDGPHIIMAQWIYSLMEVFEVKKFSELEGINCRVSFDHSKVYKIGHFLKDKWFEPSTLIEGYRK